MRENIIGREREWHALENCMNASTSQLIIVYGRLGVGKTYLVDEFFDGSFSFRVTGLFDKPRKKQLQNFREALESYFRHPFDTPGDWIDAFNLLRNSLDELPKDRKRVLFFDELPWMATQKSDFLAAFEWFWNDWGCAEDDVVCIVCGSATSWMVDHIDHNKGGLFNRQNCRLYLEPFNLYETRKFLESKNINWSSYDIAQCYMIMGGIPFYLNLLSPSYSVNRNIDEIFFRRKSVLWDEFEHLYHSLFSNSELYIKVVEALSEKNIGLTRMEIAEKTKLPLNGVLSKILQNLADSGFIRAYRFYGNRKKQMLYQLCDYYTLFYFRYLKNNAGTDESYWTNSYADASRTAWSGFTFEQLCRDHVRQIKQKLFIAGVLSEESAWFVQGDEVYDGAQIDMLIDRRDRTINICEMKFSSDQFAIDKNYDMNLRRKIARFTEVTKTKKTIQLTFITTYGVKKNMYSGMISNEVTLEDLFAKREI